jgi:hypothetical protein|tara:strand:- start:142 stop:477 length:336 start_codon:yes stop_codon:yes gene_type:complete
MLLVLCHLHHLHHHYHYRLMLQFFPVIQSLDLLFLLHQRLLGHFHHVHLLNHLVHQYFLQLAQEQIFAHLLHLLQKKLVQNLKHYLMGVQDNLLVQVHLLRLLLEYLNLRL